MAGIDNIRSGQPLSTSTRNSVRNDSTQTSGSDSAKKSAVAQDAVSLSSQGKAVGEMHNQMVSQPSFDKAKVAAIKEAIANGSYSVDPEKLADNMMKFEKELGGL
ncbi:flagellar biosynthesis anti-sigma factor FlgM [Vibrio brasiliensis]|jgi:negative regulator of flagellin synthesis FlgM|uniref:Negative regulator of flagellin synthesis n=1 Tax=Vibrio brasiliensis LMG 20546 TaxID=945543 RepID=E8M0G9_9VIBR|nr:flagellar biosynthesis anti-sigma factor FlgM [Vibrio brasiliensis]EGA63494.1 negative regulator of flagellin synthesis FlgM [Vibrio brasiliensis LMG 20546]MCG9649827.1 flagellar biosynthesis anti-sigma factor FlgM [Vibrio brasiliensis]MCG9726001.1 flagellar biosynthesis anti-sigma factor FlgM [Vibrio brasiliensis]MCG9750651.1 flagellar biosynthesis anti-sigma factor FlgM [Vibrio brasiliensis]MCG9781078.1 flagellar biosynthesis anti-sigma factor FlgM [Vibrio brasiliensis]